MNWTHLIPVRGKSGLCSLTADRAAKGRRRQCAGGHESPAFRGDDISPFALAATLALLLLAVADRPAEAKPRCHEGFQEVRGRSISTPYCEDEYPAQVAREYGSRISADTIRQNPNAKRDICRFIGRDIRINQACIQFQGGRGRY